ncbi:sigma-70 family RNA polymerase sigma factor [Microbacterium sp. HSID17254]|uniref:RNA polymerase sigma factor n=1 Tax=Microbacterium TaxID=33882 RepID=UPI000F89BC56|nr:sigma-70 family RNA polymerase sigma factor [Microbacterium sp. HSID17254]RUQ06248.1 sigma-70 family RNA polymerase sigma factor [Microbacterium sp. HSID17254]
MSSRRDIPSPDLVEVADEILAERAICGDADAFKALIVRYGSLIRAYVARIVGSLTDADDVTQEALYTAWRRLPELRDPAAVKPWLMRVASRHAFAHLRHRPPTEPLPILDAAYPSTTEPETVAVRNAQLTALSQALDNLPDQERRCWLLREVGELSYDDIAKELDIPRSTVRGKLARARASIHAQMEGWR